MPGVSTPRHLKGHDIMRSHDVQGLGLRVAQNSSLDPSQPLNIKPQNPHQRIKEAVQFPTESFRALSFRALMPCIARGAACPKPMTYFPTSMGTDLVPKPVLLDTLKKMNAVKP